MGEYIRKSDVINMVSEMLEDEWGYDGIKGDVESIVSKIPSFNAAPVVHGKWNRTEDGDWECSNCTNAVVVCDCGKDRTYRKPFCPNCGAKMDLEDIR